MNLCIREFWHILFVIFKHYNHLWPLNILNLGQDGENISYIYSKKLLFLPKRNLGCFFSFPLPSGRFCGLVNSCWSIWTTPLSYYVMDCCFQNCVVKLQRVVNLLQHRIPCGSNLPFHLVLWVNEEELKLFEFIFFTSHCISFLMLLNKPHSMQEWCWFRRHSSL